MGANFNSLNLANGGLSQINSKNISTTMSNTQAQPYNNAAQSILQNTNPDKISSLRELKKDTIIIGGKEIKKKTAIMRAIAGFLTIGGIAAGIYFAIRKRNLSGISDGGKITAPRSTRKLKVPDNAIVLDSMPKEISSLDEVARKAITKAEGGVQSAKDAQKEANELCKRVKNVVSEVEDLFSTKASQTKDGRKVAIFANNNKKGEIIIKEYAADGKKIVRTSVFRTGKDNNISKIDITEPAGKVKRNKINVFKNEDKILYTGGIEPPKDGIKKYDCKLDIYRGKPAFYASGCTDYTKDTDIRYIYKKAVDFDDGRMKEYWEGYEYGKNCKKFAKKLDFNPRGVITVKKKDANGKTIRDKKGHALTKEIHSEVLDNYYENLSKYSDGSEKSPVSIAFMKRPGSPGKHYIEGYEKSAEGKTRCQRSISYDRFKNLPAEYEENTQYGIGKWDKYYKLESGNWYEIPPES